MPTYDYLCSSCAHVVEVIHGIHDDGPRFCPNCGAGGTMRKAINTLAVHFKGSGWAKKDRSATASSGKSRSAKATDGETGSAGTSGAGTGEGGSTTTPSPPSPPATPPTTSTSNGGD